MGKEWLYWGGGGSRKSAKRGKFSTEENKAPPSGCMCAVLQIFDLNNHFQFALNQQPSFKPGAFFQDEPAVLKGVEAPRNSLELEEPSCEAASMSSTIKEDASLNIPVGIQIRTSCDNKSPRESTSECSSCSPGTKTPGVVARLMGLDLLPEGGSPSLSSSRHSTSSPSMKSRLHHYQAQNHNEDRSRHLLQSKSGMNRSYIDKNVNGSTHSLPVTPRMSSARRSDVDHRLSLQINKENNSGEEFDLATYIAKKLARRREARQDQDENRSPGHYARQIVKQVKKSVSRKVGLDITNTIKNRDQQAKDDQQVALLKAKKPSRVLTRAGDECSPSKQSTPSRSPRLRFLDMKNKPVTTLPNKNQTSHSPKFSSSPLVSSADNQPPGEKTSLKPKPNVHLPQQQNHQEKPTQKCEKLASKRYNSHLKKPPQASDAVRNKKEELFVRSPSKSKVNNLTDKMCKRITLSNQLLNSNVPTLLPLKKEDPSPATKLIHKQVSDALSSKRSTQLSSCSSPSYNQETTDTPTVLGNNSQDRCNGATTSSGNGAEYQYIERILKRTGIDKSTPVSIAKWYSPSHPLDPATFHYIELFHHTNTIFTAKDSKLSQRANRKLIFQLVDELLAEILKPYINFKPWLVPFSQHCHMDGSKLIDTLCSRIQAFPSANCQVLDDIDALIDRDLRMSQLKRSNAFEEEGEYIVTEIERDIVDSLVHEMALEVFAMARPYSSTL